MKLTLCRGLRAGLVLFVPALLGSAALAQQDFSKVEVKAEKLGDGVWMLTGAGGNLGVSAGEDGVALIDDQYAPLTDRILAAIRTISARPVRFLINTHWHGDHTGGNENLGKAGALIFAHENVRKRMSVEQLSAFFKQKTPAAPKVALPVVTFTESVTFHLNGDEIEAFHVPPAHTDGDTVIVFRKANVIHAGDLFFNGLYPFIDLESGGSVEGVVAAADRIYALCDVKTKVIPGHGPAGTPSDLKAYRDMVAGSYAAVKALVAQGKTVDEAVAAKPTAAWDEKWGKAFIKPEAWVSILWTDADAKRHPKAP
jgi:cyclase